MLIDCEVWSFYFVIFQSSKDWFLKLAASTANNEVQRLDSCLKVLLGLWLCERSTKSGEIYPALHTFMEYVQHRLYLEDDKGNFDPCKYDSKLLLICYNLLSSFSYRPYGIERFAERLAIALSEFSPIPSAYSGEAMLLNPSYPLVRPSAQRLEAEAVGGSGQQLLRCSREELLSACNAITRATLFGQQPLETEAYVLRFISLTLPILMLESLRQYDLEMGALLLRTIRHACLPMTEEVGMAIDFLKNQQQLDGRFGYFSYEVATMVRSSDGQSIDPAYDLYVPITLSCIWSLAELTLCEFNLFNEVVRQNRKSD